MLKPAPHLNLVLAPMEGMTDAPVRELLTEIGAFDFCIAEFLRISQALLPDKVFLKHVPELKAGGRTASGCPVLVQLLGGNAELLAKSARQAIELGALGIDLNFGCPAPTVNRHDGGATLLKYPERIEEIVSAVRTAVPAAFSVSAKLRLGWDCSSVIFENAKRAEKGGASWITVHARTKAQGYAPPADWQILRGVVERVQIPVVVNGDLWTVDDLRMARKITGANAFMLGRGALADPFLSLSVRGQNPQKIDWLTFFRKYEENLKGFNYPSGYLIRRTKQWLRLASMRGNFNRWEELKHTQTVDSLFSTLLSQPVQLS